MLALVAVAISIPFAYSFPASKPVEYQMDAHFEGFLPIFGGIDGTADIMLAVSVVGIEADIDGSPRVAMDLSDAKVKLKDATLPFDVDSVRKYFPLTTITIDPLGKMLKTDAPDVALPIRLPGLDVKRFPEICFLPVEFPKDGVEANQEWSYERELDGATTPFKAILKSMTDDQLVVGIEFVQSYENFENEAKEVVQSKGDAVASVATTVEASGEATFDRKRNILKSVKVTSKAHSICKPFDNSSESQRDMTTEVTVALKP